MKAALVARSHECGLSPSDFVREALTGALGTGRAINPSPRLHDLGGRARLSLRMRRADVEVTRQAAREAGLATGDFIAALVLQHSGPGDAAPAATLASLTASCAELASLSRNLHDLTQLLRQGSIRAAQEYRQMLDTLDGDVRAHLELATTVVAQLRPLIRLAPST